MRDLKLMKAVRSYPFWGYIKQYPRQYILGIGTLAAVDLINVLLPLLVKLAIDAIGPKNIKQVIWASVGYFILMIAQSYGRYLWRIYLMGTSHFVARDLRLGLYRHLQKLPLEYHQRVSTGDLMSRATNDIESVRMALGPGILVTADAILMLILIIPPMLFLSVKLSLLAFAFYPLVPWITKKMGTQIDVLFEGMQQKMSNLSAYAQESFSGVRLIRSLVLENETCRRFQSLSEDYKRQGFKLAKWEAFFSPSLGLLTNLGTFLILVLGGFDVLSGAITVGTFVAFQRFVVQLSWPMEAMGWAVTMHREGFAAQRRIDEVFKVPEVRQVIASSFQPSKAEEPFIEIKKLEFHYPDWSREHDFSLHLSDLKIQKGQKIGVVGRVGSGKTTLLNLWLRMYEPKNDSLFLSGQDLTSIPLADLRRRISMVEQHVFLFSESISTNVSLGLAQQSEASIQELSKIAQIYEEVSRLPNGFKTLLGERGLNLSGGQKQRLALVRALLRKPEVLLLDDCFSAVDVEVESKIIDSFFDSFTELTVLFASHRLSVMSRMDEVWVMDKGTLVEKGPHSVLLRKSPLYQQLWNQSEREVDKERLGVIEGDLA
jgi:ATP-binding cassette, subfamily B, multidrug efflux pump